MLTIEGCRERRKRLMDRIPEPFLILANPVHLRYFANFYVDPFSLGSDFGGVLIIGRDGTSTLYHDNRLPKTAELAHVDRREVVPWYDGQSPGRGPRSLVLKAPIDRHGGRLHDSLTDPLGPAMVETIAQMRRAKDPDEIETLRECMKATEAGHAWARQNVRAGQSELEVYEGIFAACCSAAGHAAIVYGDFAVSPGSARRGGPPTGQVLRNGDMLILDFSVILSGYRSDFTNTLVVGRRPTPDQTRLFDSCVSAMSAGEGELRAGATCQCVYDAVRQEFERRDVADHFPHHAGHGLGLGHPEAPFIVRHSGETLAAGDVVTLEPGLYVDGIGGIRIEHNYVITTTGFERLSNHVISLTWPGGR